MHTSLRLKNTCKDTVQILAWLLDIFHLLTLIEFDGFQNVARLPFVRDGYRQDVQLTQGSNLILLLAHTEHLDDALIGLIVTILSSAIALCYPHGLMLLSDGVTDIL